MSVCLPVFCKMATLESDRRRSRLRGGPGDFKRDLDGDCAANGAHLSIDLWPLAEGRRRAGDGLLRRFVVDAARSRQRRLNMARRDGAVPLVGAVRLV